MSELLDKMNQQFTDMQKLANDFHAMAEQALIERDAARVRVTRLEGALKDMLAGWRYIRETHGDLYGVGWDRAEKAATNALEGK